MRQWNRSGEDEHAEGLQTGFVNIDTMQTYETEEATRQIMSEIMSAASLSSHKSNPRKERQ